MSDEAKPLTYGFGGRINEAIAGCPSKKWISDKAGVSLSQLSRYMTEESQPTIEPMARIAEASGVNLEWLITGRGPKLVSDGHIYENFDTELLVDAIETLESGLDISGRSATPRGKAELIVLVYELLSEERNANLDARKEKIGKLLKFKG